MPQRPRHRGPHLRRAGAGLLALIALAAVAQSWIHFTAGSVPRSNTARRVADPTEDPVAGTRLALADTDPASFELADVRVAEADRVPESRPSPPAEKTSSEPVAVDVEPPPELSMAQAGPEMAMSPVEPGEADIGSAVDEARPEGNRLPERLVGVSEVDPRGPLSGTGGGLGPLSGIGGALGPLIGIVGGIALGGASGLSPIVIRCGGSGCPGTPVVRLPGPIAAGPERGGSVDEGRGPLGGNPTAGSPTIRIPTTVPVDPSDFTRPGGRGFVLEVPDPGRTHDRDIGGAGTPIGTAGAGGSSGTEAAIQRAIEEAASRAFGTRTTRSDFRTRRELQGRAGTPSNATPPTMRERVQRALVRPSEPREARPTTSRRLQSSVRTRATPSTPTAAPARPTVSSRQARTLGQSTRTRANEAAAAALRRASTARAPSARPNAVARPTRAVPKRPQQQ